MKRLRRQFLLWLNTPLGFLTVSIALAITAVVLMIIIMIYSGPFTIHHLTNF